MRGIFKVFARAFIVAGGAFALAAGAAQANSVRVLHSFAGSPDGSNPSGPLISDPKGNLYGVTQNGGAGHGVVFKVSPRGKETVLYSFTGGNDGNMPSGALAIDADGNLYGATQQGGANHFGVVFKLTRRGREIVLHNFTGGDDGGVPEGGVTIDTSGNLYGTTAGGGADSRGTVFMLTPRGREIVLYTFTGGEDGYTPMAGVVRDANGTLYGTTRFGGLGNGVVFKVPRKGKEIVMYSFTGGDDGAVPFDALLVDADGNVYGTAEQGGAAGHGVVFRLAPRGRETVLHSFAGGNSDGAAPDGGLVADARGNLYGTTAQGGSANEGTLFMISPRRKETVLHTFTVTDGALPGKRLLIDTSGNLYGTANIGGADGDGVVFKMRN